MLFRWRQSDEGNHARDSQVNSEAFSVGFVLIVAALAYLGIVRIFIRISERAATTEPQLWFVRTAWKAQLILVPIVVLIAWYVEVF